MLFRSLHINLIEYKKSELESSLKELFNSPKFVILCLGQELRGNDKIGIYIGQELKTSILPKFKDNIVIAYNTPINFLSYISRLKPELILVIDAISGEFEVGKIILSTPPQQPIIKIWIKSYNS